MIYRETERATLARLLNSNRPEFLAIYGRRRVGKTFLVKTFFSNQNVLFFRATGEKNGTMQDQLDHFSQAIGHAFYDGMPLQLQKDWESAFSLLTQTMKKVGNNQKIVLFLDELPWMATPKSRLLQRLDYYWNHHWSHDPRIKLIICGSSASWIKNKILKDKGGLHNRITQQLLLEPFDLRDTKRYLNGQGIKLNHKQIADIYMLTGGVPYYLSYIKKGRSSTQIIEDLAFGKTSPLLMEFDVLFASLFHDHQTNVAIIRAIASKRNGIGQSELFSQIGNHLKGKKGLGKLQEMVDAGFIIRTIPYQKRQKGVYYRLTDEYTLFYLKWIEPIKETLLQHGAPKGYWAQQQTSASWRSWSDLAFESMCYKHLYQIAAALDLSPTALPYAWRYIPRKGEEALGAQIDLLFDRQDDAITLCEIKYATTPLVVDKAFIKNLNQKIEVFTNRTKTGKQIFIALIAANGVRNNAYIETYVDAIITLRDLFKKI